MKMGKKSIFFWRLLLSFISLLIPMIVVTALSYIRTVDNEKAALTDTIQQSVYSTVNSLDTSIATARSASLVFLNQQVVSVLGYPASYGSIDQKLEQIQLVKQFAYTRQVAGSISDNMFLYGDDKTVYADGSYLFDDYFSHLAVFSAYDTRHWKDLLSSDSPYRLLEPTCLTTDGGNVKKTVTPLILGDTINGVKIKLVLCLSSNEIKNKLNMSVTQKDTQFIVLSDTGKTVVNTADADAYRCIANSYMQKKGVFEFEAGEKKYVGICVYSNLFGWHYFAVIPASSIRYETNGLVILLLVSILMLSSGILFAVKLTLSIYRPIQNIRRALNTEPDMKMDSSNYLGQIEEKVENLITAYSRTSDENRMIVTDFIDESFTKLVKGQNMKKHGRMQMLLKHVYGFQSDHYLCLAIQLTLTTKFNAEVQDTERINLVSIMQQAVTNILSGYAPAYVMEYSENLYFCILGTENEEIVTAALQKLNASFSGYSSYLSFSAVMGGTVNELSDIRQPFLRIFAALQGKSKDNSDLIDAKDYPLTYHYNYKLQDEFELTHLLKNGNLQDILNKINALLDSNLRSEDSPESIQLLVQTFYFTGMRFLAERNETLPDIDKYLALRYGEDLLRNIDQTKTVLENFFEDIVRITFNCHTKETDLSAMIEKYVRDNYSKDLYLEKIAEDMGLSVKYISRIFKKTTGKNLTDYINDVRMEHVRQMLTQTDLSIKDISEAVGIYSRSTFIRLFKKSMNVTPSEYRNIFK